MDIKRKLQEFNKRWNIVESTNYEEEFKKFKTRVINIFHDIDSHVSDEGISLFCNTLGIPEVWKETHGYNNYSQYSQNIINALVGENDEKRFYRLLEIISFLPIEPVMEMRGQRIMYDRNILFNRLAEAIELSNVNLAITAKNGEIILYPRGEKELDKKLVDDVLSFLNEESQKHFVDALKFYQQGAKDKAIKSAESLRRAFEEFLRFKLRNNQGLANNISELQRKLKSDSRDPVIRNIIFQTFSLIDQYFNENSKHKDGDIDEAENEYLIYQTGLLMRYIDKNVQ